MTSHTTDKLVFNFGYLLEGIPGASTEIELDYPTVKLDELYLSPLVGKFRASRTAQGVFVKGELRSMIDATCARCMKESKVQISIHLDDHYYLRSSAPEGEYKISVSGLLNLGPLVREIALLSSPIRPICSDGCQGFCVECGQNLNEADCGCEDDDLDPRMAVLKALLEEDSDS